MSGTPSTGTPLNNAPLADELTLDDAFERIGLLHLVYGHVRDAKPPCVIGIHGDWGAGKSSFLLQLEALLTNGEQRQGRMLEEGERPSPQTLNKLSERLPTQATFPVVWFEAWRHQHDPQPVITLLREIRRQLSPSQRAVKVLEKVARVAIEASLASLDGLTSKIGLKIDPEAIRKIGERNEAANFEIPSLTVSLTEVLDQTIEAIVKAYSNNTGTNRLIVLIDDLDRCSASTAQSILEGLKVFLQLKNVVFVIAMDETVVEEFIMEKLGAKAFKADEEEQREARKRSRQYLEKLCQAIYRLPLPSEPEKVLLGLLKERNSPERVRNALEIEHASLGPTGYGRIVPPNPRKIKLLAEVLHRHLSRIPEGAEELGTLVRVAYLLAYCYQFEPEIYRMIESYRVPVLNNWIVLACSGEQAERALVSENLRKKLTLPSSFVEEVTDPFPDPVRSGIFYPGPLLRGLSVTDQHLEVFFG